VIGPCGRDSLTHGIFFFQLRISAIFLTELPQSDIHKQLPLSIETFAINDLLRNIVSFISIPSACEKMASDKVEKKRKRDSDRHERPSKKPAIQAQNLPPLTASVLKDDNELAPVLSMSSLVYTDSIVPM
jgi:hypothetical protein